MTFQNWQRIASTRLQIAGFSLSEARATARFLLDFHSGQKSAALLFPDQTVLEPEALENLLRRLEKREPLPYLLGSATFFGLDFQVSKDVLIPRPETEFLVQKVLEMLPHHTAPRVCDLGTGSGAIALSVAKNRPDAHVFATEISSGARQMARQNALYLGVCVELLEGAPDWFSPLESLAPFDVIVSNPPYIAAHELENLQPEVRDYEPRLALDGGDDGLLPYRAFAARGRKFLQKDGFFAVELGANQWETVRDLFELNGWKVEPPILDFAGIKRHLIAFPKKNTRQENI